VWRDSVVTVMLEQLD